MKKFLSCILLCAILFNLGSCSLFNENISKEAARVAEENTENDSKKQNSSEKLNEINKPKQDNNLNNDITETSEKTINKKIVVIDPGHATHSNLEKERQSPDSDIMKIKDGGGADGVVTKVPEYEINMKVAMKLKKLLEKNNVTVIMTKTKDEESLGNIERAEVGNKNNANLEIRIHCDSAENSNASGASMLVPANIGYASSICEISKTHGKVILDSMVSICGMKNRGIVERDDMTGFNWSKVPVVLIEMGFMSNPNEDKMLNEDSYQEKLAKGLCEGILSSLNN